MVLAWLGFFDALIAIALVAAGIIGAHFALLLPYLGFQLFLFGTLISVFALLLGLIGLWLTSKPANRMARPRAQIAVIVGLVVLTPVAIIFARTHQYPAINDITTDFQNPPPFVYAAQLPANRGRSMEYNPRFAAAQEAAYGKLPPLALNSPPDEVFKRVEIIAGEIPEWRITNTDPKTHTVEGIATSYLFRFNDDFVIEVRAVDGGKSSLVEMRSKSRAGIGDLGTNFHRIASFFAILQASQQPTS